MRTPRMIHATGVLLTIILAGSLAACEVGGGQSVARVRATISTSTPTASVPPTATPFFVNGKAYRRVTDSMFGFSFAIPADMQQGQVQDEPQFGGDFNSWASSESNSPLALNVTFGGNTKGLEANQCPGAISGPLISVVTVGSGLKAYQTNGLIATPTTSQGGAFVPNISASFVSNGIVVAIELTPQSQGNLMIRYGPIWQEMLASFEPGTFVNPNPPCGA